MLKKMFVAGLLLFTCNTVLSLFSSCERRRSSNGTQDCPTGCFSVTSSSLSIYDGAATNKLLEAPYLVKATNLIFKVMTNGMTRLCLKPNTENRKDISLFSTAYAVVAMPTCHISQGGDSVITYNIYSNNSFDAAHPAGSNLKDLFETNDIPTSLFTSGNTVSQILYEFFLETEPASDGSHIFTIELVQKDGDVISMVTPTIQLQK